MDWTGLEWQAFTLGALSVLGTWIVGSYLKSLFAARFQNLMMRQRGIANYVAEEMWKAIRQNPHSSVSYSEGNRVLVTPSLMAEKKYDGHGYSVYVFVPDKDFMWGVSFSPRAHLVFEITINLRDDGREIKLFRPGEYEVCYKIGELQEIVSRLADEVRNFKFFSAKRDPPRTNTV